MSHRDSLSLDDSSLFLTDAGMETALIFHQGQELPSFATFPLLETVPAMPPEVTAPMAPAGLVHLPLRRAPSLRGRPL